MENIQATNVPTSADVMPGSRIFAESKPDLRSLLAHPLLAKGVILPTPPIDELLVSLRRAVMLREQGCCFTATSGFGKSYGLMMAERELNNLFEDVPIYRHIVNNQQVPSVRAFFKHFLVTVGEKNISGETFDLRLRLVNNLIDSGRSSRMNLVVILIDEAQGMALQDFQFLKDIGNQLENAGIQLVVIMMGQDPDFSEVVNDLRLARRLDLISRFTLRRMKFRGICSEEDFERILSLIDIQTYPPGSNCTWPQFFVPKAWANGFRMKEQSWTLTTAVKICLPNHSLKNGVSARQLFLAIRRFLMDYADIEHKGNSLPENLWQTAVNDALIEDAAIIAGEGKQKGRRRTRI